MLTMKISENGRVVIPAEIRQALQLRDGDVVYWELFDGEARLSTKRSRLARARALFDEVVPGERDRSLAEELIEQRRREAATE